MKVHKIQQLIGAIQEKYGYDFSKYHQHYIEQELDKFIQTKKYKSIQDIPINQNLVEVLLNHSSFFFRNPDVFLTIKNKVFPHLATLPHIKIWHTACGRGEEVYSLAMLLEESNLLHKI